MLTREDVTAAYQLLLGREPESDEAIRLQIANASTFVALRNALLTSEEFLSRLDDDEELQQTLKPAFIKLKMVFLPKDPLGVGRRLGKISLFKRDDIYPWKGRFDLAQFAHDPALCSSGTWTA